MNVLTYDNVVVKLDAEALERFPLVRECIEVCGEETAVPLLNPHAREINLKTLLSMQLKSERRTCIPYICHVLMLAHYMSDAVGIQWLELELYRLGKHTLEELFDAPYPLLSDDAFCSVARCFGVVDLDGPAQVWRVLGRNASFDEIFSKTVHGEKVERRERNVCLTDKRIWDTVMQRPDAYGVLPWLRCVDAISSFEQWAFTAIRLEHMTFMPRCNNLSLPWFNARVVHLKNCSLDSIDHTYPSTQVLTIGESSSVPLDQLATAFFNAHSLGLSSLNYSIRNEAFNAMKHLSRVQLCLPWHRFTIAPWVVELFVKYAAPNDGTIFVNTECKLRRVYTTCPLRIDGPGSATVETVVVEIS